MPARAALTLVIFIVLGMSLTCIHIFIITESFSYWCVMRPASLRFFIYSCIYLRIVFISYLATFLGTNSLSVLMCHKAVNQSSNRNIHLPSSVSHCLLTISHIADLWICVPSMFEPGAGLLSPLSAIEPCHSVVHFHLVHVRQCLWKSPHQL